MLGRHLFRKSGPSIPIGEKWTFTSNGTWVAPATGTYKVTLVGGGGRGGNGGNGSDSEYGTGGTGGSAGQLKSASLVFNKDQEIPIVIGTTTKSSSFGNYITAKGGSNGSAGTTVFSFRDGNGGGGGTGANGYGTAVTAGNGSSGSGLNHVKYSHGGGGRGGTGYGAGGGGGGGSARAQTGYTTYGGNGGAGANGVCIIEYMGR